MCPKGGTFQRVALGPDGARLSVPRFSLGWWQAWTMPIPETGCHIWLGTVCKDGYGRIHGPNAPRKASPVLIHRVAFEQLVGPISEGMKVCHRCDVPSCVNPDHLFLGTQKDNLQDMFRKGRARPRGRVPRRQQEAAA